MFEEIEISNDDKRKRILTNIIKMLTERKVLHENKFEKNLNLVLSKFQDDTISIQYSDSPTDTIIIKLIFQNITSIAKNTDLGNFLDNFQKQKKIIVVTAANKRVIEVLEEKQNTEVFLETFFMVNIIDHVLVPKHIPLSKEESKELLEKYKLNKRDMPIIRKRDAISKYYNLESGNIVKIIRPSETAGQTVFYRLVV